MIVRAAVERVNRAGRWSETRGRREKVLLHHLQSLYRTLCDRRAQFNEAVFLVFSAPPCSPPSPQMALLFHFSSPARCVLAFALICPFHICSLLFHLWRLTFCCLPHPAPPPSPASNICVLLSLLGGLSHRGRHSQRRFRLWVCRGNTAV